MNRVSLHQREGGAKVGTVHSVSVPKCRRPLYGGSIIGHEASCGIESHAGFGDVIGDCQAVTVAAGASCISRCYVHGDSKKRIAPLCRHHLVCVDEDCSWPGLAG